MVLLNQNQLISVRGRTCLLQLDTLILAFADAHDLGKFISRQAVEDELGRYKTWAGNIGALQRGPSSLDDRLNNAPDVADHVRRLLLDLSSGLARLVLIASGKIQQQRSVAADSGLDFDDFSGSDSDDGKQNSDQQPHVTSEADVLYQGIVGTTTNLLKLSMAIRHSSSHNSFAKSSSLPAIPSSWDVQHVLQKFPKTQKSLWLAKRLGEAITRRRQHLTYRANHRQNLASGLEDDDKTTAYTKATSLKMTAHVDLQYVEEPSDDGHSATTYNTVVNENGLDFIKVPPPPESSADCQPFECPYCLSITTITGTNSWRKHVYRDLQPYVCTLEGCEMNFFASRHEWFDHELFMHRQRRTCCFCGIDFRQEDMLLAHLKTLHHDSFTETQLPAVVSSCGRTIPEFSAEQCPLCDEWASRLQSVAVGLSDMGTDKLIAVSHKVFRSHVGRHLEQLALFAVPRSQGDDGTDDQNSDGTVDSVRYPLGNGSSEVSEDAEVEAEKAAKGGADPNKNALDEAKVITETSKEVEEEAKSEVEAEGQVETYQPGDDTRKRPIKFKDAVGRKFSFPWALCKSWKGMEELIKQACLYGDVMEQRVQEGKYDLIGPQGEIITPELWEHAVEPDWLITMRMWPMPSTGFPVNEAAKHTIAHESNEDSTEYLPLGKLDDTPEEYHHQSEFAMRLPQQLYSLIPKAEADDDVNAQAGEYDTALQAALPQDYDKIRERFLAHVRRGQTGQPKLGSALADYQWQLMGLEKLSKVLLRRARGQKDPPIGEHSAMEREFMREYNMTIAEYEETMGSLKRRRNNSPT